MKKIVEKMKRECFAQSSSSTTLPCWTEKKSFHLIKCRSSFFLTS